ncbi:hypothetical protein GCM10022200_27120 [Microbacterium awajiense]|uniref:Dolichol-P-glucose synthetase-like protein n=1 Tax=Microbacterium awajiense TaxID=415214 RepID=A0ABP7AWZ9_9MICO
MTVTSTTTHASTLSASPRVRALLRAAVGLGILVAVVVQVGAEPFVAGLAAVSVPTAAIALGLGAIATVAAAWRWRVVAAGLGLRLDRGPAIEAYYRSQFLNSVLPGGIVGDVHRVVWHGRGARAMADAARAVAAERAAGQAVQLIAAVVVLILLREYASLSALGAVILALVGVVAVGAIIAAVSRRVRVILAREVALLRTAFGSTRAIAGVTAASLVVIACHVVTFVVAAQAVGVDAPTPQLVSVSVIAVLAGGIPLGIGGWGPREGVAAWAFASVGLGAASGLAASTAFGVLALIAVAPGAVVVAASARRGRDHARREGAA